MTPSQDITLGCYYLTAESAACRGKDAMRVSRCSATQTKWSLLWRMARSKRTTASGLRIPTLARKRFTAMRTRRSIETTAGRVIFSEIWPKQLGFFNKAAGKKQLGDIIWRCYKICGHDETVATLDA